MSISRGRSEVVELFRRRAVRFELCQQLAAEQARRAVCADQRAHGRIEARRDHARERHVGLQRAPERVAHEAQREHRADRRDRHRLAGEGQRGAHRPHEFRERRAGAFDDFAGADVAFHRARVDAFGERRQLRARQLQGIERVGHFGERRFAEVLFRGFEEQRRGTDAILRGRGGAQAFRGHPESAAFPPEQVTPPASRRLRAVPRFTVGERADAAEHDDAGLAGGGAEQGRGRAAGDFDLIAFDQGGENRGLFGVRAGHRAMDTGEGDVSERPGGRGVERAANGGLQRLPDRLAAAVFFRVIAGGPALSATEQVPLIVSNHRIGVTLTRVNPEIEGKWHGSSKRTTPRLKKCRHDSHQTGLRTPRRTQRLIQWMQEFLSNSGVLCLSLRLNRC